VARRARRPITVWFWLVVVMAVFSIVPISWAQQSVEEPGGLTCGTRIDPAGMGAFWIWCGLLALLVLAGWVVYARPAKHLAEEQQRKVTWRLYLGTIIACVTPVLWWAIVYAGNASNCTL